MCMHHRLACVALLSTLGACGDDPVSYSAPVAINLKAKSADTVSGVVSDEKGISTESGNPYGKFVSDARAALGGRDPATIELDSVDVFLGAGSTGVTALGEIFNGRLDVVFVMNDTDNSYPAAHVDIGAATTAGPIGASIDFDGAAFPAIDEAKLLGGSFKVLLRGPAAASFETKGADADVQLTFTFAAFE